MGSNDNDNIKTTASEDDEGNKAITIALSDNLDLGAGGSLKIGDTTVNNEGLSVASTTVTSNGLSIVGAPSVTNVVKSTG